MIKSISKSDLPACLDIFHRGYETIAVEFGLTDENCPDRGRASLPIEKLIFEFNNGKEMYGYYINDRIIGFLGLKLKDDYCKLDDIIILPEYRQNGYGKELLDFSKLRAREYGAKRVVLGMIDDNKRLKRWYEDNGFINIGYVKYESAPFTVGRMECTFKSSISN